MSEPTDSAARPHVLIVDDEPMILAATGLVLKSAGFRISTTDSGNEAVAIAADEAPNLVLLDIMMPEIDGWETLARLQEDGRTRAIPVVIFTAREHSRGRRLAREMGAVDYLQKPFEAEQLIELAHRYAAQSMSEERAV